jgi:hypothetical protein
MCSANIDALLSTQAPDWADAEFMSFPEPETPPVQTQPPQTQEPPQTEEPSPTTALPTTMATSIIQPGMIPQATVLCANLQFLPSGGSVGKITNCNGDPNLTVTFPPVHKRSIPTLGPRVEALGLRNSPESVE